MVESDFSLPFFFLFFRETAANLKVFPKRLNAKFSSTCVLFSSQTSVQTTSIQHEKKLINLEQSPGGCHAHLPAVCSFLSHSLFLLQMQTRSVKEQGVKKSRHTSRGRVQICTFSLVFLWLFSRRRRQRRRRTKPHSDSPRCARRRRGTFHGGRVQTSHLSLTDWRTLFCFVFFIFLFFYFFFFSFVAFARPGARSQNLERKKKTVFFR